MPGAPSHTTKNQTVADAPGDWAAITQSHLSKMSELRHEVRRQFNRDAAEGDKAPNLGGPAMEDRLKRRWRVTQNLATQVATQMEAIQHVIFQVRQAISNLSRGSTNARAALSVAEMRLELRQQRPESEMVEDAFQDALVKEHSTLVEAIRESAVKLQNSSIEDLEKVKVKMQESRLTLHLDRSGDTQQLLDRVAEQSRAASFYCRDANAFLAETDKRCKKALARTLTSMKQKIAATIELKEHLEQDMKETKRTIAEAELNLERTERLLEVTYSMPERNDPKGGDFCNEKLSAKTGVLADLRTKIKAAAYTGAGGRNIATLFTRFDRDGSGQLDEDEVRRAFRRACRIPPSAVTDAEIASLCGLLDEDKSGSVDISEIIDFLCADVNVESLEEQVSVTKKALEKLKKAQAQSQADLRNKVLAWKIDVACARVNPIKGLKLDTLPTPRRPNTSSMESSRSTLPSPPSRPTTTNSQPMQSSPRTMLGSRGSPRKPKAKLQPGLPALTPREDSKPTLDPTVMDALRSRIKAAAYSGTQGQQLDGIFARFAKNNSGTLGEEELKLAMRRSLRITQSQISDDDIHALVCMLDKDQCGEISISDLVAFVGSDPQVSKRQGKAVSGGQAGPAQSSRSGPPDESAGPSKN